MHPSRLLALGFVAIGVLLLAEVGIAGGPEFTPGPAAQLAGGVVLLVTGLYGTVRYEENPIVTEYGPLTYFLLFGQVLWGAALLLSLVVG